MAWVAANAETKHFCKAFSQDSKRQYKAELMLGLLKDSQSEPPSLSIGQESESSTEKQSWGPTSKVSIDLMGIVEPLAIQAPPLSTKPQTYEYFDSNLIDVIFTNLPSLVQEH